MHPWQYLVSRRQNILYPPKVCQNCYQIACRTDVYRSVQPALWSSKTSRQSEKRPGPYFARHPLRTFRLCLHIRINAR